MQTEIEVPGVSKEDLYSWLSQDVTRRYFSAINELAKDTILEMAGGATLNRDNAHATAQQTAEVVGFFNGLRTCLKVETEEIEEKETDGS